MQNYNMHSMWKTVNELHAMLKLHEQTLPKKDAAPALHAIRAGKVQKNKNQKLHKAAKGNQGKGKTKLVYAPVHTSAYAPKPKIPPPPKKDNPAKDAICHQCGEVGHWRRNCPVYLAELLKKRSYLKELALKGLRGSKKLKPGALSLYMGNGIISVSRLYDDGFVNRFENNAILVSMYVVSNKKAKLNLDSSLLWHYRLRHVSKKRIENLQHDGLLNSTDIKSFEKCVSCMSGKMTRKPYSHQVKRAKHLLGLIHTDVCGPFRTMPRQGASYFITFTHDFSRYGYVYLLKHKHEVFETYKMFQKEVENQLKKTIKSLRSDRGGEYMSQEVLDHCWELCIPDLVLLVMLVSIAISSDDGSPPTPPPAPQTPISQTSYTLSTVKLPILKRGEYDIWAMKMEHYLSHTDYPIWEVIQKGNGPVNVSKDKDGQLRVLPLKNAKETLAREREIKARTTLLMALPEDHLARFHRMDDAKEMWDAIKSIFGSNDESKKMQKYILKQQFEGFSMFNSEGLHKVSLVMRTKPGLDSLSFDDLYNNLRAFESDVKGSNRSSSKMDLKWQVAMISMRMKKFYKKTGIRLQFDTQEQVGFDKTKVECFNCHKTGHFARECRSKGNHENRRRDAGNSGYKAKDYGKKSEKQEEPKALVTLDGEGIDWSGHAEDEQENFALMAYSNSGSDTEVTSCSKECKESYDKLKKLYDKQREQLSVASIEIQAYDQALKKVEAQLVAHQKNQLWYEEKIKFMKIDLEDKTNLLIYNEKLVAEAEKEEEEELNTKLECFQNSSKGLGILLNSQMSVKDKTGLRSSDIEDCPENDRHAEGMHVVPPLIIGIYIPFGPDKEINESQFTYETLESVSEPDVNEPKVGSQPKVWSDTPIIEEYESDSDDDYVSTPSIEQEQPSFAFVNTTKHVKTPRETIKNQHTYSQSPKVNKKDWNGLMSKTLGLGYGFTKKACFVCDSFSHLIRDCDFHKKKMAKQAELNKRMCKGTGQRENRPVWNNVQTVSTNPARKVNTVRPRVNEARPRNVFHKSHSPVKRPINNTTALKTKFSNQKVNTAGVKAVSVVGGMGKTAVKPSANYVWRPKRNNVNKFSKYNGGSYS
ncbi:ribonuclease H-like domain-containing protein [Tanacetum coccineum]